MKQKIGNLSKQFLERLTKAGAVRAEEAWAVTLDIPDHGKFPVLVLPKGMMSFGRELGFFCSFKAFKKSDSDFLLVAEICSFNLEEGAGGWAIPLAYKPKNEIQALRQILGFDENWENGMAGPLILIDCTPRWKSLFSLALAKDRLGFGLEAGESVFPMVLNHFAKENLQAVV